MQVKCHDDTNFVPFTIDDLRNEQEKIRTQVDNLRKSFFVRYSKWEKEKLILKQENRELKNQVEILKGSNILCSQESKIIEFSLESL